MVGFEPLYARLRQLVVDLGDEAADPGLVLSLGARD
jgi:hypothetical protein